MAKMYDVGERPKHYEVPSKPKKEIWYPSLSLNTKQVPALKGADMNDNVTFVVQGKIKSLSAHNNNPINYCIDVHKVGITSKSKAGAKKSKVEEMFGG
jgi:hypothetical protein